MFVNFDAAFSPALSDQNYYYSLSESLSLLLISLTRLFIGALCNVYIVLYGYGANVVAVIINCVDQLLGDDYC